MRRSLALLGGVMVAALIIVGCSSAAPAPAPTKAPAAPAAAAKPAEATKAPAAPAAPAKAAEPTKAPAQPTAVPFPEKGKAISLVVPWAAGGGTDVGVRMLAPLLEKDLGVPVEVINKAGGGSQIGLTDIARAKPDGYTVGSTNLPSSNLMYLDPQRKATFDMKSFQPLSNYYVEIAVLVARPGTPYKTAKDMVDAAKANPNTIRMATSGNGGDDHLDILIHEQMAGVKYRTVHFDGGAPRLAALLGENSDVAFAGLSGVLAQIKSGELRCLAVLDKEPVKLLPGVTTMESQGFKHYSGSNRGFAVPAGTPKPIVDRLAGAFKKAIEDPTTRQKLDDLALVWRYEDPAGFTKTWEDIEVKTKEALKLLEAANK